MPDVRRPLPVEPLLVAFRALRATSPATVAVDTRSTAIQDAIQDWLNPSFLDTASTDQFAAKFQSFYVAVSDPGWHLGVVTRNAALLRHGLIHLLRGDGSISARYARCATPTGTYSIPGLGHSVWTAILKALNPGSQADWFRPLRLGLKLLGYITDSQFTYDLKESQQAFDTLRAADPSLSTHEWEDFLVRVAGMRGRELPPDTSAPSISDSVVAALRSLRIQTTLRQRIAHDAERLRTVRSSWEIALHAGDVAEAISVVRRDVHGTSALLPDETVARYRKLIPRLVQVHEVDELDQVWDATSPPTTSDIELVASILHLHRPELFPEWREAAVCGVAAVDDGFHRGLPPALQYRLAVDVAGVLRRRFRVHPSEIGPLLEALGGSEVSHTLGRTARNTTCDPRSFGGFSSDTFRFLDELATSNTKTWMTEHRERYRFVVRDPLAELCTAVADRYIRPVLGGDYGWELETDARPGRSLSSIVKNDFGRSGPYVPVGWVTYYRRQLAHKRDDVQLFVRVASDGITVGFHLGRRARDAGRRFRANIQEHATIVFEALKATGATEQIVFGADFNPSTAKPVGSAADLREWATTKDLVAFRWFPPEAAVLRVDEFAGEVLILFDRIVPLFATAVEDNPRTILAARAGSPDAQPRFDRESFRVATSLSGVWLTRALSLLRLKKQLILQGVPGTGKTHVARCLARHIAGDRSEAVRLIQFHPGYSYEEFVEGIRPKATPVSGGSAVTYPVESGLLIEFAARAERHPADTYVLVVDEINRGNLSRVFGELLFLLEYREQEVTLPYSKRSFRLPPNLYLIGTMNPADRSAVGLDAAMRRRFSFVDMPPDPVLLARWFEVHPPADPDPMFGPRVVEWFDSMNRRLARELGPDRLIGHSALMLPGLTAEMLQAVWEHHVRPALDDYYSGQRERIRTFAPDRHIAPPRRAAAVL